MALAGALQSLEEHPSEEHLRLLKINVLLPRRRQSPRARSIRRRVNARRAFWSRQRGVESDWTAARAASRKRGSVILK